MEPEKAYAEATLPAVATARDDEWWCQVIATDTNGASAEAWVGAVVVNGGPTLAEAQLSPQPAHADDTLVCTPVGFEDPDDDEPVYAYQWTLDTGSGKSCNCHSEVPEPELDSAFASKGYVISCQITPSDDQIEGETVHSVEVEILNSAPTAPEIAILPEVPVAGDQLAVSVQVPSEDADGDSIDYQATWTVDGAQWGSGLIVFGEDVQSGQLWEVSVIASDGTDTSSAVTASVSIASP